MNFWTYWTPLFLLLISIIFFCAASLVLNKYVIYGVKSPTDCSSQKYCKNDPSCCVMWVDNVCRKGTANPDGTCTSSAHYTPIILAAVSLVFLVAAIVVTIMIINHNRKKVM